MHIFLGSLNIFLGLLFLLVPIIFIEFARSRDLIKATFLLLLGIFLILSSDNFTLDIILLMGFSTIINTIFVIEVFTNRWIQLSESEKKEFKTLHTIKSKLSVFFNALKITFQMITKNFKKINVLSKNQTSKKWVRSEKKVNKNISEELKLNSSDLNFKTTNIPKKDIIKDEKF